MQRLAGLRVRSVNDDEQSTKAETRTRVQRDRILAAAQCCFVQRGFHAASMAEIAEKAGMSPGLIYRYFENKNAIILAIIEHQLEVARCRIRHMHASDDFAAAIVGHFDEHDAGSDNYMSAALFLEMSAEATRDPQIAEAIRGFDSAVRAELRDWLGRSKERGGYGLPRAVVAERALMLVCLIDGLKARKAREPALDRKLLRNALAPFIDCLMRGPSSHTRP